MKIMSVGINSRDPALLHPALQRGLVELRKRMTQAGFSQVGVSSTYRDGVHQDWLFEQGRSRPGAIVTNARAGQSWHNHQVVNGNPQGLAFDIFQNIRGQEWNNPQFFATAGRIWIEMGGEWGGSWTSFPDRPHFQFTGGLSLRDLQNGRRLPETIKMSWENNNDNNDNNENDTTTIDEVEEMRYNTVHESPEWARPTLQKLIDKNLLKGNEDGKLDLSLDMIRIFIINDRAGLYN